MRLTNTAWRWYLPECAISVTDTTPLTIKSSVSFLLIKGGLSDKTPEVFPGFCFKVSNNVLYLQRMNKVASIVFRLYAENNERYE